MSHRAVAWLAVVLSTVACGGGGGSGGDDRWGYDYAASPGAAIYAEQCEVCHGEIGEGGLGPPLLDTTRPEAELADRIAQTMPANDPGRCDAACAAEVARFIKEGLTSSALRCDAVRPLPRRIRLLTRREYRATVRDLFGDGTPALACERATDCGYRDVCDGGACEASACDAHTFVFDPGGRALGSVHVAGSFNGWAGSVAAGGWPLAYSAETRLWTGTFPLAEGTHAYKLVLDGAEWVADPRAPASQPDGFGGQNSVLELSCAGGGLAGDPAARVPPEPRPGGFLYDDNADAAIVTAAHVDAYLAAAETIADAVAADLDAHVACDWRGAPAACAPVAVDELGLRVLRRPLTGEERARYAALVTDASGFADGLATAVHAMLVSPHFLYRSEVGEPQPDGTWRLTPWEVATALSYGLVGTTPDAALLDAAAAGELATAEGIEAHARRLLADPRARDVVGTFALQWLGAEAIATVDKSPVLYPGFDARVRASLAAETRDFVTHVVFDGSGTLAELFTADYTVVDPVAAAHYGLPGAGVVRYGDGRRAGVLGHASVLATTAHSDQTSPIRRGLLVRRNLLCQDLPPPPPDAGGVPDVDPGATTRERFAQHTDDPVCAGCHQYIDDVGFGFESFDAVGRWRDAENGAAIDPSGNLNDVEGLGRGGDAPYTSLPTLAGTLATSTAAPSCFVRQYARFARGFRETLAERCGRLWLEDRFLARGGDVRELLVDVFLSPDFLVRR